MRHELCSSGVAQWLACWAHNPKVRGSKPRSAIAFSGFKMSATAWGAGNRTLESPPTQRSVDRNHALLWHSGPQVTNSMSPAKAPWSLLLRCWQLLAVPRLSPVDTRSRTVRSRTSSGVAQWLACWAHNPKVRGSKPRSAIAFSGFKISATAWGAGNRTLESAPTQRSVDRNHAPLWHSGPHVTNNMAPAKAPWSLRLRCWQLLAVPRLSPVDTRSRTVRSRTSSGVAQWLACWAHNPKARGSKPRCAISWLSLWCVPLCYYGWLGCSFIRVFGCVRCVVVCSAAWCEMRQERIELPTLGL